MAGYIGTPINFKSLTNLFDNSLSTSNWEFTTSNYYSSSNYINFTVTTGEDGYFTLSGKKAGQGENYVYGVYKLLSSSIGPGTKWNYIISYVEVKVKCNSSNRGVPYLFERYTANNTTSNWKITLGDNSLNDDQWHTLRGFVRSYDSKSDVANTTLGIGIGILNLAKTDILYFKDIKVINLTSAFGKNKEPFRFVDFNDKIISLNNQLYGKISTGELSLNNYPSLMKQVYLGINNQPKKVKKIYIGVDNSPKLFYDNFSYKDLFSSVDKFYALGQGVSTSATFPAGTATSTYPTGGLNNETWYLFYTVGGSLEISKVILGSNTMSKTKIDGLEIDYFQGNLVNHNKEIQSPAISSGAFFLYLHFNSNLFTPQQIDNKIKNSKIKLIQYYAKTTTTTSGSTTTTTGTTTNSTSETGLGVSINNCTFSNGVLMPLFSYVTTSYFSPTITPCWGVVDATAPTSNSIKKGQSGSSFYSDKPLLKLNNNIYSPLYYSSSSSSITPTTYGYTLIYFGD